ncbi:MAG: PDZ domain-containing protein [bacterium]|nr:PDZ domain-containing protein [bacterium]
MSSWPRLLFAIAILACLGACASRPVPPALPAAELEESEDELARVRVQALVEDRGRLLDLEYALATSVAHRCGTLARPHAGVLLTRAEAFEDDELRDSLVEDFAPGRQTTVVYVVPGGPFGRAGIAAGDQLLAVDGDELGSPGDFIELMHATHERSSIEALIGRGDTRKTLTVELESACPVMTSISADHRLVTSQPNRLHISIPLGVLRLIDDRDTLAVILAHEMAHALFGRDDHSWARQEKLADRDGLLLAARAGFDPAGAVAYWELVAIEYPWLISEAARERGSTRDGFKGYTHYGIGARLPDIRATVEDIQAQLARLRSERDDGEQ